MQFGRAILSGIVLWAVVFAIGWMLMAMGVLADSAIFMWIMLIVWILAVWITTAWYKPMDLTDAFVAGLIWLIVVAILDYFITVKYLLPNYSITTSYYTWSVWVSYAVVLLLPTLYKSMTK